MRSHIVVVFSSENYNLKRKFSLLYRKAITRSCLRLLMPDSDVGELSADFKVFSSG